MLRQPKVDIWKVNKDPNTWTHFLNVPDELLKLRINVWRMPDHLGDPHVRHILRPHNPQLPRGLHLLPAQPAELCLRQNLPQRMDDLRPVLIPRSLTGRQEEMRVGIGRDSPSLPLSQCLRQKCPHLTNVASPDPSPHGKALQPKNRGPDLCPYSSRFCTKKGEGGTHLPIRFFTAESPQSQARKASR
jgi:hypothetical protein